MLTEQQLKKLTPLTSHPKYGPIVKAAIIGWKKCKPVFGCFGLRVYNGKFLRNPQTKGCCFLGAVVLNRKYRGEGFVVWEIAEKFKISIEDAWSLSDGFETPKGNLKYEALKFGQKVRKALGI